MVSLAILSVVPIPDLAMARQRYQLDDLDDVSVAKVLFHRRKQSSGGIESLRWDHCAIGAVCLIEHRDRQLTISHHKAGEHDETTMLEAIQAAAQNQDQLLSWTTEQETLPLLRFRAVKNGCAVPSLWLGESKNSSRWADLADRWTSLALDRPDLDEIAVALGLPGLYPLTQDSAVEAWMNGDSRTVELLAIQQALNLYLMALRLLFAGAELSQNQLDQAHVQLSAWLAKQRDPGLKAFHSTWRAVP